MGITSRPFPTPPYYDVFPSLWYMNIACSFLKPLSNNTQFYKRFCVNSCVFPYFSQHEDGMGLIEDNEINNNTLAGVWITTGIKRLESLCPHSLEARRSTRLLYMGSWSYPVKNNSFTSTEFFCRLLAISELAGNSSYRGKFQWYFDQGKGNLVRVSGEFELSEFEFSRFCCRIKEEVG